jgi:hypothetical protein
VFLTWLWVSSKLLFTVIIIATYSITISRKRLTYAIQSRVGEINLIYSNRVTTPIKIMIEVIRFLL